jgi:hypothetical protein
MCGSARPTDHRGQRELSVIMRLRAVRFRQSHDHGRFRYQEERHVLSVIMKFGAFAAARRVITEGSCSGRRRFWRRRDRVPQFGKVVHAAAWPSRDGQ